MTLYSRHFLKIFWRRFLWVFAAVQIFVLLAALLDLLPRVPYADFGRLLTGLPDLVIIYLPISLPFPLVLGGVLLAEEVRRQQGFLWIRMAGHDPRRYLAPILGLGLFMSVGLWGLNAAIIPRLAYSLTTSLVSPQNSVTSLSLLLAKQPDLLHGFIADFGEVKENAIRDFTLVSSPPMAPTLATADSATLELADQDRTLLLTLRHGRFLRLTPKNELAWNSSFDKFQFNFDVNSLFLSSKTELVDPIFYTNHELSRLPELAEYREHKGLRTTKPQRETLKAAPQVRATRLQSALMPFLYLAVAVWFLGGQVSGEARGRTVFVLVFCLAIILPQQVVLEQRARMGSLPGLWTAFLPGIEALAVLLGGIAYSLVRGNRRP